MFTKSGLPRGGLSWLWTLMMLIIGCAILFAQPGQAANFTIFTPQVDAALQQAPDWLWDVFAGIGIALGTLFAFVGARMLRTAAFFFGTFAGALLASVILAAIGNVESQIWLPVVIASAVVCGVIVSCIVSLAKIVTFIVLGVVMSGVFVQYALSYIDGLPDWVLYMLIGIFVVISAFLTWKAYKFLMIFATSFVGGFVVLVSVARFTRGPISLAGMWVAPQFLQSCVDMTCWGPFIAGAGVCLLGLAYQLRRFRGKSKSKTPDKKTQRELEAAERARRQEKERFEQRVQEIRRLAEAEIQQATMASRKAVEGANQEREALLRQHRQLEEEQERLRQERLRIEQEARVVEAEYVHFNGNIEDLPLATPATPRRIQLGLPKPGTKKPQRPATRPPPPTPDGWGGGARPWNKCPEHQVAYNVCGCTNPRSKEQVLSELQALKAEKERFEQEQRALAERNSELRERLKKAEEAAMIAATQASLAQQKAQEEVVKSGEVEERLEHERRELERLLKEAEVERLEAQQQLQVLQETRKTVMLASAVSPSSENNNSQQVVDESEPQRQQSGDQTGRRQGESAAVVDGSVVPPVQQDALATNLELQEEELRLRERMAQAEGLEDTLRREIEVLAKSPQRVLTERDLGEKLLQEMERDSRGGTTAADQQPAAPSLTKRMSLHVLPNIPLRRTGTESSADNATSPGSGSKFASKWSNVERTYSLDDRSGGSKSKASGAGSATATATTARVPLRSAAAGNEDPDAPADELEPVRDLFSDLSQVAGTAFQFLLEATVFIIATIGMAIGKCADAARDAHMERQEQQLRHKSQKSSQFRASNVKERFSSPGGPSARTEDV